MTQLLQGISAKIERAEQHIENLNTEISEFLRVNPKPYHIARKFEPDGLSYIFTAYGDLSVPLRFSIIAGEVVHHVRSSFDHLIHALIIRNGGTPTNFNQFPIRTTHEKFEKSCDDRLIEGVSRSARELIRSVQPYKTSSAATSTLKVIHDLDITDKHRLLNVVAACVGLPDAAEMRVGTRTRTGAKTDRNINITNIVPFPAAPITNDGTEILCIKLSEPEPEFYAEINFSTQIMLDVAGEYMPAVKMLTKMLKYTTRTVSLFKGEF